MEKQYNMERAAKLIDVSLNTMIDWDESGEMIAHRRPNGEMYYTEDQIINAIEKNSDSEVYYVIENRNVGTIGQPEFVETILFAGSKEQCVEYEDYRRNNYKDKDRIVADCWVVSDKERKKKMMLAEFWKSLPAKERKETITVNGKTYYKALYDRIKKENDNHKEQMDD